MTSSLDDLADAYRARKSQPDSSRHESSALLVDAERRGHELFAEMVGVLQRAGLPTLPVVEASGARFGTTRYAVVDQAWDLFSLRLASDGRAYEGGTSLTARTRPASRKTAHSAFELAVGRSAGLRDGTAFLTKTGELRFALQEESPYARGLKVSESGELLLNDGWSHRPLRMWLTDEVSRLLK